MVRQSASLVAGICTLCVAASTSVTPVPAAAAATPEQNSPVVRPFELTAASDVLVDSVNVASLPLQNFATVLNALAGAAGGGNGTGGGGATSFQALANVLYSQLVAGNLTEASATTAINAALTTEQTALTNLAATPGKIIATDVAAIQNLASDFGASTLSVNKVVATAPAASTPKLRAPTVLANTVSDQKYVNDATAGLTTPARHAAKANDNNPVSNTIKVIKEASKDSYVGRHRAEAAGAMASTRNGKDGSKGSNGK